MRLIQLFNRSSIQLKLTFSNVLAIATAVIPLVIAILAYEYHTEQKELYAQTVTHANMLGDNMAAAVAFHDKKTVDEILSLIQASEDVISADVILPSQQVFAHYQSQNVSAQNVANASFLAKELSFTIHHPIRLANTVVGELSIQSSLVGFYKNLTLFAIVVFIFATIAILLSVWVAHKLCKGIIRPIKHLTEITEHVIKEQDYSRKQNLVISEDEIGKLSQSFERMMQQIHERDINLKQLAFYDSLTGLANRHYFENHLTKTIANSLRDNKRCVLMFIDLDDFKNVNDSISHQAGDVVLKQIGNRLRDSLRTDDFACRIGGDEFAVVLENVKDLSKLDALAQKMIDLIAEPVSIGGQTASVGASIGISICPDIANDLTGLLTTADRAMYIAKQQGKNCYHRYVS